MAENSLLGGVNQLSGAQYPSFQPMPQPGGLGQLNDLVSLARNAQGLQQQQFELGKNRTMFVADRLGSLLTKPDLNIKDAQDMVGDMVRNQMIPASEAPEILKHFPQDPEQLRASVKQSYLSSLDHVNRMNLAFGAPISAQQGQSTLFGRQDVMNPGQVQLPGATRTASGTTLPLSMSPGLVEGPPTRGPNGEIIPTKITTQQAEGIAKGDYKVVEGGKIVRTGGTGGQAITGAPIGAPEAEAATAKTSADMAGRLTQAAAGAPTRTGMLNNLEDDLKKFDSGPLAGYSLQAKRLVNDAVTRTGLPVPQWDPQSVAAQENFNKQATQLAQQQFSALGGTGTDQQLGSAFKANPNDALSPMGNKQIVSLLKGNEDAIRTMNTEWQKWKAKNGSNTFDRFQENFNNNFSPRAFQFARMNKPDREEMLKGMQPNERAALGTALKNAEDRGWIKPD